ncbi:TetR/AcrR family transcriptional regulator [Streptomyces sp. TRM66268-LWL]|uniref:TetR/AcrR family transcriptional regulator n=1 Tax=Streptomyces polyasparticus TaxID=2767826 RepID=A0ABR7SJ49_9ACTN|nr:TetR/AcrR family transcriptional regulator [Streptomyces polyasparticus]MBC9715022.1 TetR/AcrR family transcriptional regulator [Streptomyces polyasparticus]
MPGTAAEADSKGGSSPAGRRRWRDPERTRAVLVEALLDLVAEGEREPTRKAIAERAGVSERTVFVHFADREALYVTAAEQQAERWRALAAHVPSEWPVQRKVRALLDQRGAMYEVMSPIRKVGLQLEPESPGLRRVMAEGDDWFRTDLARVFAPELAQTSAARRPGGLLDALEVASSWAAWDHLRTRRGLAPAAARSALTRTLRALLEP